MTTILKILKYKEKVFISMIVLIFMMAKIRLKRCVVSFPTDYLSLCETLKMTKSLELYSFDVANIFLKLFFLPIKCLVSKYKGFICFRRKSIFVLKFEYLYDRSTFIK